MYLPGTGGTTGQGINKMSVKRLLLTGYQEFYKNMLLIMPNITIGAGLAKTGFPLKTADGDDGDLKIGLPLGGNRFTDMGDGTIYDGVTGLMWIKNMNLVGAPIAPGGVQTKLNWEDTLDACEALIYAGHSDWRCPNINEIQSLFFINLTGQQIDLDFFNHVYADYYWSSTTYEALTTAAWITEFIFGKTYAAYKDTSTMYVMAVRGGQINV